MNALKNIILKPIEKQDLPAIRKIITEEWYKQSAKDFPKATEAYVHFDVNSCLMKSNFGQVAVHDNEVVGVILSRDNKNPQRLNHLIDDPHDHLLTLLDAPREATKPLVSYLEVESKAYGALFEKASLDYDGEAVLFITKKAVRGHGVGSKLFHSLLNHFDNVGVDSFYLYTDDSCHISFYHHKGLHQRGVEAADLGGKEPFHFYLFDSVKNR